MDLRTADEPRSTTASTRSAGLSPPCPCSAAVRLFFVCFSGGTGIKWAMPFRFSKHYTLEAARALLPQVRKWLEHIEQLHHRLNQLDKRLSGRLEQGEDIGGESVNT